VGPLPSPPYTKGRALREGTLREGKGRYFKGRALREGTLREGKGRYFKGREGKVL